MMPRRVGLFSLAVLLTLNVASFAAGASDRPPIAPVAEGRLLALPSILEAALRRDHRSPDIYLIASRDGGTSTA